MKDDSRPAAPDYTQACVVMFGVNLSWILFAVWAVWGLMVAALMAWSLNLWIERVRRRRSTG